MGALVGNVAGGLSGAFALFCLRLPMQGVLGRLHRFVYLFLFRGQTFIAPPHRQAICARGEHTERWSSLILNVLWKLNLG
jgi:hypothetical protein